MKQIALALALAIAFGACCFAGYCVRQAEEQGAAAQRDTMEEFVLNTSTKRFHRPDCGSTLEIAAKNREPFMGFREDLIEWGFQPCAICKP